MRKAAEMDGARWSHHNPVQIHAGFGALDRLPEFVDGGARVLLVTTAGAVRRGVAERVATLLGPQRTEVFADVTPNPELDALDACTAHYAGAGIGAIVALGGGSVIDAAKVLSVTLPSGLAAPLESVLRGASGHRWASALPLVAVPTTSGTGAEVTPFATVWDTRHHKKHSVVGPQVYPRTALLDASLTLSLPPDDTLYTALDAISHSMESLWNRHRTPVSEAIASQALRMALDALPRVLREPANADARALMQQASTMAGLAISQTRTAIAHSISYPLTSHHGVPHGLACSFTLPQVARLYLRQRPDTPHRALLESAAALLAGLDLHAHVHRYASDEQIRALQAQMHHPARADNFDATVDDLSALLDAP